MENQEYIKLFPSYWIYNAGIVGIIRTLHRYGKKEEQDYKFVKGALILKNIDSKALKIYYINLMEEIFGKNWFYGKILVQSKKGGIFTNNSLINGLKLTKYEFIGGIEKWLIDISLKDSNNYTAKIGKWRFIQWIIYSLSKISKDQTDSDIDIGVLKQLIQIRFKEINKNKIGLKNFEKKLYLWEDDIIKELMVNVINYFALKNPKSWLSIWDEDNKVKKDVLSLIEDSLLSRLESIINKKRPKKMLNKTCAVCGVESVNYDFFETKWFSYEGGSKIGFKNFYYNDSTQLPICENCQLVFYFSPLGIFPDSNINYGEFINISDIKYLWELNNYRMEIFLSRKKEKWLRHDEKSKLIDAIVASGSILQLKSRWLLQNIELIELGGKRGNSVYNLTINPVPLKLISDYSSESMARRLSHIEDIHIRRTAGKKSSRNYIYTKKYTEFTNGREIIEKILNNDTGWIIKTSILLFKLYFEENLRKEKLNTFERLMNKSLKSLLLINLSLLKGKESYSEFLQLGRSISKMFKNRNDFERTFLPSLFNCVYTSMKNDFIEILMRIYVSNYKEVDDCLLKMFTFNNTLFQTESLLLLIGILQEFNKGEKNEY